MSDANIIYLSEVDSTNRYAVNHFNELADGTLVAAEFQTAGRGRFERRWISPPDQNAYVSFVVKDFPYELHKASWIGSLAVLDVFARDIPDLNAWLKWPNDVYCGNRKISGMLCEGVPGNNVFSGIVIGIGVNINMTAAIIEKIDQPATSVLYETGRQYDVRTFVAALAECLSRRYRQSLDDLESVYQEWKGRNFIVGRQIELLTGLENETVIGRVLDIGRDGELIVETADGPRHFFSGDVRIDKKSLFS